MPIRLLVKSKGETGSRPSQEVVLDAEQVTLGRDKACEVVLNDPVVSRRHAQIVREGVLYFLEDTGSSYGTRINGSPLPAREKRLLKNGDVLAIGPYDVTFDRIADVAVAGDEKTSYVAKRVVKDALRGLASGDAAPYLRVMNGPLEGKRYEVHDAAELVIGREEGVDILLERDDLVSRRHAKVRRDWAGMTLEDLGSRNGVRLNRKKVTTSPLKDRDEIEVGNTRFLFLDPTALPDAELVPEKPAPKPVEKPAEPAEPPSEAEPSSEASEPPAPEESSQAEAPPEENPEAPAEGASEENSQAAESGGEGEGEGEEGGSESEAGGGEESGSEEPAPEPASEPEPSEPSAGGLKETLAIARDWRNVLPLLVVVGIALFALGILAVTFFVL